MFVFAVPEMGGGNAFGGQPRAALSRPPRRRLSHHASTSATAGKVSAADHSIRSHGQNFKRSAPRHRRFDRFVRA